MGFAVETVQLNINSNSWYCSAKARDLGSNGIYTIFQTDAAVNQEIVVVR
jgi:hypothetical protein